MCCCTHQGRLSATWKWASQPSGHHPSTMPASPPLRWVQHDIQNIIAGEILFSMFVVRLLLMSDCDCLRGGTAARCLQMKSRPLCSWELWTPSSSSHMLWWVANTVGLGKERGRKYLLLLYVIINWLNTCVRAYISAVLLETEWTFATSSVSACAALLQWWVHGSRLFSEACCDSRVLNHLSAYRSLSSAP